MLPGQQGLTVELHHDRPAAKTEKRQQIEDCCGIGDCVLLAVEGDRHTLLKTSAYGSNVVAKPTKPCAFNSFSSTATSVATDR